MAQELQNTLGQLCHDLDPMTYVPTDHSLATAVIYQNEGSWAVSDDRKIIREWRESGYIAIEAELDARTGRWAITERTSLPYPDSARSHAEIVR